jgi:hypothetical protein
MDLSARAKKFAKPFIFDEVFSDSLVILILWNRESQLALSPSRRLPAHRDASDPTDVSRT